MSRSHLRFLLAALLSAFALVVSACGGDDDDGGSSPAASGSSTQAATTAASGAESEGIPTGKKGGTLNMLAASDVDFNDPGHTYYTWGMVFTFATNRPLYSFKPDDGVKPVPDLAAAEPEISADKKTVTVKIRPGIKYAPPVDREVTSADVKYAVERFFSTNVGGQYPGYFQPIVGAPATPTKGVKPISGIEVPDATTIVFRLKEPVGVSFAAALVMPITIPVPEDYAKEFDAKSPSTYNTHVAFTGPYMIENDATTGELTGYKPAKSITLVRNPNWDAETDFRPAYLDKIFVRTNASDANVSARQVIEGQSMGLDTNPPANILRELVTQIKGQYTTIPSGGYRYFPMNTEVKPFDDLNVRKAVMAAFDRDAARKARGGKYVGDIATHWLPPDFPGFEESGGYDGFGFDYFGKANEKGDMAVAAKYMKAAGYASGKYEGDEEILMVGANADPGKAQSEVAKAQLEKLGFKVRLRLVPQDAVYTDWCQVPAKKVGMCGGAGWFKDFSDPQSMLEPVFKGSLINRSSGNINYSMLNVPAVDEAMDKAALLEGDARLKAWAGVDKMIVEQAAAIPFIWDKTTMTYSKNVQFVGNPYIALWDLSFTSLK